MQELNQGEDYEEDLDFDLDFEAEGDEDTESEIETIYGIPKNIFIIGVIVLVLVVVLVVVFALRKTKSNDVVDDSTITIDNDYSSESDTTYVDSTSVIDTSTPIDGEFLYDESGNLVGTYSSGNIMSDNGTIIGVVTDTGTQLYDYTNSPKCCYTPSTSDSVSDATVNDSAVTVDSIGADNTELRKLGYTGDEIELAIASGIDTKLLIDKATELRNKEAKDALVRMSDSASDEFQLVVNNSIFCMEHSDFPVQSYEELVVSETHDYLVNADYVKVPTYGTQLFIKCKIANGTYAFYNVTPTRWVTLPEVGNIVLRVTYQLYGNGTTTNLYVTKLEEVDTTELTVNPQESGVSLQDVVNTLNAE